MNELNESIKSFNLIFTKTISLDEFCQINFDIDKVDVNYDNCVSLKQIIETFTKVHKKFKEEYDEMDKLNLGKFVEIDDYLEFNLHDEHCRVLNMYINNPTFIDKPTCHLYLREVNGKVMPFIDNNSISEEGKYFYKEISLDENISKNYLDLFQKYSSLLDFYNFYNLSTNFGNSTFCMFSRIKSKCNNFLDEIDTMSFALGSNFFMSPGDHMNISFDTKNNIIDIDECYVELDGVKLKSSYELYEKILNEIYVNKKNLNYSIYYRKHDHNSFDRLIELKNMLDENNKILKK